MLLLLLLLLLLLSASVCLGRQWNSATRFSLWLSCSACCGWTRQFYIGKPCCNCRRRKSRLVLKAGNLPRPSALSLLFPLLLSLAPLDSCTAVLQLVQAVEEDCLSLALITSVGKGIDALAEVLHKGWDVELYYHKQLCGAFNSYICDYDLS